MMENDPRFRAHVKRDLEAFVGAQRRRFADNESLVIDLHCHDHASDVPDELLGRILHWPETWVTTDEVRAVLAQNGTTALTITNHNNARSCYELLDRGVDVLVGAEFTCTVPEFEAHVHVLTYGFAPAQEERLLGLRGNLCRFLGYAREQDHTDWIDFARGTLKLNVRNTDRVRRLLRAYYRTFDRLLVLNSEHLEWLASSAMGIPRSRLRQTALGGRAVRSAPRRQARGLPRSPG